MDSRHSTTIPHGFTLIEMVIVIVVIGILSVAVSMQWTGMTVNLDGEANQLQNDLRYTQSLSMTQGVRFCLVLSSGSYQIVNSGTSTAVLLARGSGTITLGTGISFGTLVPSGVKMFVFDGKGAPYSSTSTTCTTATAAAATALSANGSIPLIAGGSTESVVISPETGVVVTQ